MSYAVKDIFATLQGEGAQAGRPAVLLRFAGCNLWSGREEDRAAAVCRFCDTDFVGGERYADAGTLAAAVAATWPSAEGPRLVVVTGGEPSLQLDDALIEALHDRDFEVAVETNGTRTLPMGIDWVTVSPKAGTALATVAGHELKLIYPQADAEPERYAALRFRHFYLQPMDGPARDANTAAAIAYCQAHPHWRLSLQTHKLIGLK
ncbi:MAG: 7-carboxy-7-deazaguanine synthase [Magnetospirillum sp.]|nr:7-carboxy-7-deazaguanine synthase [Magnetospirillum sp.]